MLANQQTNRLTIWIPGNVGIGRPPAASRLAEGDASKPRRAVGDNSDARIKTDARRVSAKAR
jgi:hypothetical protein